MHPILKALLVVEIVCCFAVPAGALILAAFLLFGWTVSFVLGDLSPEDLGGPLLVLAMATCGAAGLMLFEPEEWIPSRGWMLGGLIAGLAPLAWYGNGVFPDGHIIEQLGFLWLPLVGTIHVAYLGRRYVFGGRPAE